MNTSKQINVMILLLFGSVLVFAGYTLWDPDRADEAEGNQAHSTVRRGAYLFSQNCRTCHGDAGEGGVAADRLRAAPALNRPDLQGEVDGEITDVTFSNAYRFVYDTITCGRVGKVMPAWAQSQGGPLNEEQIKQITEFITRGGDEGWAIAADFGRHNDHDLHLEGADDKNELRLTSAIDEDDTVISLEALVAPPEGSTVNAFIVETQKDDGLVDQTSLIAEDTRLSILEEVEAAEGDEEEVVIPQTIEIYACDCRRPGSAHRHGRARRGRHERRGARGWHGCTAAPGATGGAAGRRALLRTDPPGAGDARSARAHGRHHDHGLRHGMELFAALGSRRSAAYDYGPEQ